MLGRKQIVLDEMLPMEGLPHVNFFSGTSLEDVKKTFEQQSIDIVIMGAGLDLEDRLGIIRYIFDHSQSTTVHMKDWASGPPGMKPFVQGILTGLTGSAEK